MIALQIATVVLFSLVWNAAKVVLLYDLARRLYTTLQQTCLEVKQRRYEMVLTEQVEFLMGADYQQLRQKVKELKLETSALRSSAFGDRRKPTLALALAQYQIAAA